MQPWRVAPAPPGVFSVCTAVAFQYSSIIGDHFTPSTRGDGLPCRTSRFSVRKKWRPVTPLTGRFSFCAEAVRMGRAAALGCGALATRVLAPFVARS
jgi:hypothetical protein